MPRTSASWDWVKRSANLKSSISSQSVLFWVRGVRGRGIAIQFVLGRFTHFAHAIITYVSIEVNTPRDQKQKDPRCGGLVGRSNANQITRLSPLITAVIEVSVDWRKNENTPLA